MISSVKNLILNDCIEILDTEYINLNKLKNEKIFISGGTGFVGTWLLEMICYLNEEYNFNTEVILLARNISEFKKDKKHLSGKKHIAFIKKDIRYLTELPSDITYIIHAAANPDNRQHSSDPITVMDIISRGTNNILSLASSLPNIKKILNISSGLIYGQQPYDLIHIPESYQGSSNCSSIFSIYPEAKRFAEMLSTAYRNQYKLPIINARPFTFLGPYQHINKPWAHTNFLRDSLLGGPIRITGNQNSVRGYMYASDMAYWFLKILADGKQGVPYNIGNPKGITLRDFAEKICEQYPNKINIENITGNNLSLSRFVPDVTLATKSLGLKIFTPTDAAIRKTLSWYNKTL